MWVKTKKKKYSVSKKRRKKHSVSKKKKKKNYSVSTPTFTINKKTDTYAQGMAFMWNLMFAS